MLHSHTVETGYVNYALELLSQIKPHVCMQIRCFPHHRFTIYDALTLPSWLLSSQNMCYWNRVIWSSRYFHSASGSTFGEGGSAAKVAMDSPRTVSQCHVDCFYSS